MPQDPHYPLGVSERDISYDDPAECGECEEGEIVKSPCCGVALAVVDDTYRCEKCHALVERKCARCNGEGVILE